MIFTLLICCFLGLGALQPCCAAPRSNENNIVEVESKHRANYIMSDSGYYAYGISDLVSPTFITNLVLDGFNNAYPYNINVGDFRRMFNVYNYCYIGNHSQLNTSLDDLGASSMSQLSQPLEIECMFKADLTTYLYYLKFDFTFVSYASGVNAAIKYSADFLVDKRNAGPYHLGECIAVYDISTMYDGQYDTLFVTNYVNTISLFKNNETYESGYQDGLNVGQQNAYNSGYDTGYSEGQQNGNQAGYNNGYNTGLSYGETHPTQSTYDSIYNLGNQEGYAQGLSDAQAQSTTASQIFAGCVEVGLLPVNVFLKMFEYEVFGINIAGFVSALMTIAIVVIIIRMVTGKKNDK